MEAVFTRMITLSLTAAVMVVVILAARLIFKKAPKWLFCLLWGLVALRLMIPFTIESRVSLIPANFGVIDVVDDDRTTEAGVTSAAETQKTNANSMLTSVQNASQTADGNAAQTSVHSAEQNTSQTAEQNSSLIAGRNHNLNIGTIRVLSHIWLGGMIAMLAFMLLSYILLRRKLRTATLFQNGVKQSEFVDSPFLLGIIRPVIYMPYNVDGEVMANVIAHEQAHILRRDHWWKPLGFILLSVYWFNPFMWLAYILFGRDIEAACDERVIRNMDREELQAYSAALLRYSINRKKIATCPLAFGEVDVKGRVKNVMNYKRPAFWVICLSAAAVLTVAVLFLTNRASGAVNQDTSIPGTDSDSDTDYYVEIDGTRRSSEEENRVANQWGILLRDSEVFLNFLAENIHFTKIDEKTVQFAPNFGKKILICPEDGRYCYGTCVWDSPKFSEQPNGQLGVYEIEVTPRLVALNGESTDAYSPTVRMFIDFPEDEEYRIRGYIIEPGEYSVDTALYGLSVVYDEPQKDVTVNAGDAQIHAYVKIMYPEAPEHNNNVCIDLIADGEIVDSLMFAGDNGWIYETQGNDREHVVFVAYSVYNGIYSVNAIGTVGAEDGKLVYVSNEVGKETYNTYVDTDGTAYPYYEVWNPRSE